MSDMRNLNHRQFFHGTTRAFEVGDVITPANLRGEDQYHRVGSGDHAHATPTASSAWSYAEMAHSHVVHRSSSPPFPIPRVYQVEATEHGGVEEDPTPTSYPDDVRSTHGFKVIGEEKMPEDFGPPEEWTV